MILDRDALAAVMLDADPGHRATAEDFAGLAEVAPDVLEPYRLMADAVLELLAGSR